jgi:hypothetical protein
VLLATLLTIGVVLPLSHMWRAQGTVLVNR